MINNENSIRKGCLCVLTKSKHAKIVVCWVASKVLKHLQNICWHFLATFRLVFRKLSEILGSCWDVSGNPGQDQVKILRIWLRKSWQVYYYVNCVVLMQTDIFGHNFHTKRKEVCTKTKITLSLTLSSIICNCKMVYYWTPIALDVIIELTFKMPSHSNEI